MRFPRSILSRWADSLYAIGKNSTDQSFGANLIDLAKSMYSLRDDNLEIS